MTGTARISWQSRITGATGHGNPMPRAQAQALVQEANHKFTELHHWAEAVLDAPPAAEAAT